MKKPVVIMFALAALVVGALAQAPSPAPAPDAGIAPPPPPPRERPDRAPGGERPPRSGRLGGMAMDNREFGPDRMLAALVMNPEFGKRLALTPDQQDQLKSLAESQRTSMADLQAAVTNAARKQALLMLAEPLDEEALMAVVEETGSARTALAKASVKAMIEFRKVLTDEQRKQLRDLVAQMRERRDEQAGPGRERMRERMRERTPAAKTPAP